MPGAHEFAVKLPPRRNNGSLSAASGVAKVNGVNGNGSTKEGVKEEEGESPKKESAALPPPSSASSSSSMTTPTATAFGTPTNAFYPPTPTSAAPPSTPTKAAPAHPLSVSTSTATATTTASSSHPSAPATPTSTRPAPSSPALSRRASQRSQVVSSTSRPNSIFGSPHSFGQNKRQQRVSLLALSPTLPDPEPEHKQKRPGVKIRDFGFPVGDARHVGTGPDVPKTNRVSRINRRLGAESGDGESDGEDEDGEDGEDGGEGAEWEWDGFREGMDRFSWVGTVREQQAYPSEDEINHNFLPDPDDDDDDESPMDADLYEQPLLPGLYRAMYAFDPEGTAEMRLEDDQIVRVVGRGGGVGWAVVLVEDGSECGVVVEGGMRHALVPESYLECVEVDEDVDVEGGEGR